MNALPARTKPVRSRPAEEPTPPIWPPAFFASTEGEPDTSRRAEEIIAERPRDQ